MTIDHGAAASLAIVGASVRGTSLLERVIASSAELIGGGLDVHVIDPHPHGSGRIWRDGQSAHLIMNTVAAQSTLFTDDSVACEGPIVPGPSLAEWCRDVTAGRAPADLPEDVRAEASRTVDHSNPSRLLYGHYLRWCADRIIRSAPPRVRVHLHRARVSALRRIGTAWWVAFADGGGVRVDAAVLATGWPDADGGSPHPLVVPAGNPIDQDLSQVRPGEVVAVQGLGMGFFDTLSQLTEQRGGRFTVQPDGASRYEPSGLEPVLIAGSRRGVPYRAKPDFGAPPFFPEQRILRAALPALRARRPVDFTIDVLPLIERDAAHDYYRALARVRPDAVSDPRGLLAALIETDEATDAVAARHVADAGLRFSLDDAIAPVGASATDAEVADAVRRDIDEAARGLDSPLKLGLHSYAAARGALIDLVSFGGLSSASFPAYREFLAIAASFGSGPPLARARHLLAAHGAGVVRFTGPRMTVAQTDLGLSIGAADAPRHAVDRLVQAWLPAPSGDGTTDPLLRDLLTSGAARVWRFPDGSASDSIDVRPADGALIGADGAPTAGLFSVGVPHEDIRVFTIIAPVPGTNSSVLRETDAAARAALRVAASAHPIAQEAT
ncbi:MAG: FAD/NAD(P)-binding protein [Microbacterium sp.]